MSTPAQRRSVPGWPAVVLALLAMALNVGVATYLYRTVPHEVPWAARASTPRPTTTPPPRATVTARPVAAPSTPADTALSTVAHQSPDTLLGAGWSAAGPVREIVPPSYPGGCVAQTGGPATPVVGWRRSASGQGVSAQVQLWAYGAGQGAVALDHLRAQAARCPGSAAAGTPVPGARGFTATAKVGTTPVVWGAWQRGDVVVSVTEVVRSGAPQAALAPVSASLDASVRAALEGVCATLGSVPADATRNPAAAGSAYRQYARMEPVDGAPALPDPSVAPVRPVTVTLPAAAPVPALAPLVVPPRDRWADTNGDGQPDTPPPPAQAPRGAAPVLVLPQQIPVPPLASRSEAPAPARPTAPVLDAVPVPTVDEQGPGCGWAFTGSAAPVVDAAALKAGESQAIAAGKAARDQAAARYAQQITAWAAARSAWNARHGQVVAGQQVAAARARADAAVVSATRAYQASVQSYTRTYDAARAATQAAPRPGPTATPSASATSPAHAKQPAHPTKPQKPKKKQADG